MSRRTKNPKAPAFASDALPDPASDAPLLEVTDLRVSFPSEDGRVDAVRGVNLSVARGEVLALVGESGSGKSVTSTAVMGLLDESADVSGSITLHGTEILGRSDAYMSRIRGVQLSMVFQDVYLFDDTLAANICIGNPAADDAQVRWAAGLAGVTEIIHRLPHGWDTRVGEGGRALSGGERQRVSIARALLKRAPIVLLDEATSALDAENEANIVAAMEELRRTSTLIVIAHKLETIAAADQVVVLGDDGRVAQRGRHEELVNVPGPYREFWEQRSRAHGWALV